MNEETSQQVRKSKPTILAITVLSVHVAGAAFFALQGCQTRPPAGMADEPAPAPIMPPSKIDTPPAAPPRPMPRPTVPVASTPDTGSASSYTVQKGDSLSKIAAKAGVSSKELAELNNISNPNNIRIGQKLLLPAYAKSIPQSAASSSGSEKATPAPKKPKSSGPAEASGDSHTVQSGDTLGKLANRYGTTIAAFREVNKLSNDKIRVGQKLSIPKGKSTESTTTAETAVPAESSASAAAPVAEPSVPAAPDAAVAPVPAPPAAEPVMIPVDAAPSVDAAPAAPASGEAPFPYTVKEGDTLDSIAIKFSINKSVISTLNSLTSEAVQPGQKLLIPWQ